MQNKSKAILLRVIFVLSAVGMLPLFAGIGTKLGFWEPLTGFFITLSYMTYYAISAMVFLFFVVWFFVKDLKQTSIWYVVILVVAFAGYNFGVNQEPADWTGLPGVHDVTTDMENPPEFIALLNAPGRRNSFEYPQETAEKQKAKFPWIKPIFTDLSENEAYARALKIAKELDWEVVGEDPSKGRFEATDYTKWFHFHDDLVVRITSTQNGSRVDIRSLSRVGGTDHGLGAIRIMKFTKAFKAEQI